MTVPDCQRMALYAERNAALAPEKRAALDAAVNATELVSSTIGETGFPPALKPVQVAQFLLESNWGLSELSRTAHNYFGIKARAGEPFVERKTREVIDGQSVMVVARFRRYADMAECFTEHARLIVFRTWTTGGRRIYANALKHPTAPALFAHGLTGVYATDPEYGAKLVSIMRSRGLFVVFGFPEVAG